jgi:hypothetical protein
MNEWQAYQRRERRLRIVAAIVSWFIVAMAVVGIIAILALVIVTFG